MKSKGIIIFISLFLVFSVTPFYSQADIQVDRLIDRGIKYERENQLEKAIAEYRKVLEKDPENSMIKVRLAKVLSWQNEFNEALTLLNEVLEREPYQAEALFRKAQILSWQGNYKESIATYQIYLIKKMNDPDALMGIARVSFWSGENDKAITYFHDAIKAGADEAEARLDLGKVYLAINNKENAREEFGKVLDLDPKNSEAKRFLKGIQILKTWEIAPLNLRWNIYPDHTVGVTVFCDATYHFRQRVDFILKYENMVINSLHDHTFTAKSVYRGIQNLYLIGGLAFTPDPNFSPDFTVDIGVHYSFPSLFAAGVNLVSDIFKDETLFTVSPGLSKDFSDISYIGIKYNQYIYTSGYSTGTIELLFNLEYIHNNDFFIKFIYGGDIEVRDKSRRIFDFSAGISYNFTDNFKTELSYGRIETLYGKSHEITYRSLIKW